MSEELRKKIDELRLRIVKGDVKAYRELNDMIVNKDLDKFIPETEEEKEIATGLKVTREIIEETSDE